MRYYVKDQPVLANCGDRHDPDWIPGVVINVDFSHRPYQIELERPSDGQTIWYFAASLVIDDNKRNRRRKGLDY